MLKRYSVFVSDISEVVILVLVMWGGIMNYAVEMVSGAMIQV
jgi:hypothetical protein